MRVKCLAQEHNTVPWPGLEPGSLDPESSALTIGQPKETNTDKFNAGGNLAMDLTPDFWRGNPQDFNTFVSFSSFLTS